MASYRIYVRSDGGTFGAGNDVGVPAADVDGALSAIIPALDVRTDYRIAVSAVGVEGDESARSNEMAIGYADVAPLLDSDGDGLSDAAEDRNLNRVVDASETDPERFDTDGDGIGDASDVCVDTRSGEAVSGTGCSCAQLPPAHCDDGDPCTTDLCDAGRCGYLPVREGTCGGRLIHTFLFSETHDRAGAVSLDGATVGGKIYVFVSPEDGIEQVRLHLDDPERLSAPRQIENKPPYDLAGGSPSAANAFDTETLSPGTHVLTAVVYRTDGATEVITAGFQVGGAACDEPGACDDHNPCTHDACVPGVGCMHSAVADGVGCDNGDRCDGPETCQSGTCRAGAPPSCDDGNACTVDACAPATGCTHRALSGCHSCSAAADCDDGDPCTDEVCSGGRCVHTTADACGTEAPYGLMLSGAPDRGDAVPLDGEAVRGDMYVFVAPATGIMRVRFYVDDPNRDRGARQTEKKAPFDLAGGAVDAATAFDAAALDRGEHIITAEIQQSDGATVVVSAPFLVVSGSSMVEGQRCTQDDDCDDGNPCAENTCDPDFGCRAEIVPDGTGCEDPDPCTATDLCVAGACEATDPSRLENADLRLSADRRGKQLLGRALLPGRSLIDPEASGISLELVNGTGAVSYRADVPGHLLSANRARSVFKYVGRTAAGEHAPDGLRKLVIKYRAGQMSVSFRVAGDRLASARRARKITWVMRAGSTCASAVQLECLTVSRRLVVCR